MSQNSGALKQVPSRPSSLRESLSGKIISVLLVDLLFVFVVHTSAQNPTASPTQLVDVTASTGIKFVHFKGIKESPSISRNLVRGSAFPTSTATAGKTFTS
jgi:hypothetical protein